MLQAVARLICMFTCTQLIVSSCVLLILVTPLFGITYTVLGVISYAVIHVLLNLDFVPVLTTLSGASTEVKAERDHDFSEAQSEIDDIKCLISESFILSWTQFLSLGEETELEVIHTADTAINNLLTSLTEDVNVYLLINDIIKAAHLHVLRFQSAQTEQVRLRKRKISLETVRSDIKSRFLDVSYKEWIHAHQPQDLNQDKYLKTVTENIILQLLNDGPSPIALEALASILSENVLGELLAYLSQQENLLKIIVRVFSDDFEILLKSAEIRELDIVSPSKTDEPPPLVVESNEPKSKNVTFSLHLSSEDTQRTDEIVSKMIPKTAESEFSEEKHTTEVTASSSDESPLSPGQFVSEDLMNYFKIAPNTPKKPSVSQETDQSAQSDNESPKTVSMLVMTPAILTKPTENMLTDCDSGSETADQAKIPPKSLPMTMMSPAIPSSPPQTFSNPSSKQPEQNLNVQDVNECLPSTSNSQNDNPADSPVRPHIVPMTVMMPATTIITSPDSSESKPVPPQSVPLSTMSVAKMSNVSGRLKKRLSFQKAASIECRSYDSGVVSDVVPASVAVSRVMSIQSGEEEEGELLQSQASSSSSQISTLSESSMEQRGMKFVSISIPTTQLRVEKSSQQKYTLYDIHYRATYPDNESANGCSIRQCVVYRRYREFINLRARLKKESQFTKSLKSIKTPKWWQQLSFTTLKPSEVEKRRKQMELFLMQLIAIPSINICKDLEEFLAYNGGAEIEFVQEKVEFIPPAARLDKFVVKTISGVIGNVSDRLSSQGNIAALESRKSAEISKSGEDVSHGLTNSLVYRRAEKVHSDLLTIQEEIQDFRLAPSQSEAKNPDSDNGLAAKVTAALSTNHVKESQLLADSIYQLVLLLLQNQTDLSKNDKLTTAVSSIFVPLFGKWLRNKLSFYTTPEQVHRFLVLFRTAIWSGPEEITINYDIEKLKTIAKHCIFEELPAPVLFIARDQVDQILDDILEITEDSKLNEQLGLGVLSQCVQNSLSVLQS